ncbi:hypothetical protein B0H14DRAFT_3471510 [Mycena olivaceomarginata]|nr:hypothetical protein B0H14DRAFT_3471510 [Mycena olivaceomarginata]
MSIRVRSSVFSGTEKYQNGSGDVIFNGDVGSNINPNGNQIVNGDGGSNINANGNVIIGNNDNNNQISTNGGLQAQAACTSITGNSAFIALLVLLVLFAILFLGTLMLWIRERRLRKRNMGAIEEGTEENSPALATVQGRPTGSTVTPFMEQGVDLGLGAPRQRQASKEQLRPRGIEISGDPPPGYGT